MSARVIFLNGPSSSGKSTLARALKRSLLSAVGEEFAVISIDDDLPMSVDEPIEEDDVYAILPSMCRKITACLAAGQGVVIDHVVTSRRIWQAMMAVIPADRLLSVRVTCPAQVLREREKKRGDRCVGSAEASDCYLYPRDGYDVTVDTARQSPEECAEQILKRLDELRDGGTGK